jgi:hypothetical protein
MVMRRDRFGLQTTFLLAILGVAASVTGCEGSSIEASVAEAQGKESAPLLRGRYRWEAMHALNPKARAGLGGQRKTWEELSRASVKGGRYVFQQLASTFEGNRLTIGADQIMKLDGDYMWATCEAQGSVEWRSSGLSLPVGLNAKGTAGIAGEDTIQQSCDVSMAAADFELQKKANGEVWLQYEWEGSRVALVMIADPTIPDVEARAKALRSTK